MNEALKTAMERCGACEVPGLNRTHTHAEFMAGYLLGIDDGERAECGKCFNRGYEEGKSDMAEEGEGILCALVEVSQADSGDGVDEFARLIRLAKEALAGETTAEDTHGKT